MVNVTEALITEINYSQQIDKIWGSFGNSNFMFLKFDDACMIGFKFPKF